MRKLKFKKKVLKGMTLMEIIIAIAIVAIMTSILVGTSNVINNYLRSATDINDRVAVQAPIAQAKDGRNAGIEQETGIEIVLTPNGGSGSISLVGDLYAVYDAQTMTEHQDEFGHGLNMKYIDDIQTETGTAASEEEDESAEEDVTPDGDVTPE